MTQPFIQLSLLILLEHCVVVLNSRYVDNLDIGCVAYVSSNLHVKHHVVLPDVHIQSKIWGG